MPALLESKSLTIRLKPALYEAATHCAKQKGRSLNSLVQQGLEDIIRAQLDKEMYDDATLLGMDPEECSVEFAFAAQSEVALRDE